MYFIYHVTSQDQPIKVLCKFMAGSFSWYVTTLKNLVTIPLKDKYFIESMDLINKYCHWKFELLE